MHFHLNVNYCLKYQKLLRKAYYSFPPKISCLKWWMSRYAAHPLPSLVRSFSPWCCAHVIESSCPWYTPPVAGSTYMGKDTFSRGCRMKHMWSCDILKQCNHCKGYQPSSTKLLLINFNRTAAITVDSSYTSPSERPWLMCHRQR